MPVSLGVKVGQLLMDEGLAYTRSGHTDQRALIERFLAGANVRNDVLRLASHIATNECEATSSFAVIRANRANGLFVVVAGNVRLIALKLLLRPELADRVPSRAFVSRARSLASNSRIVVDYLRRIRATERPGVASPDRTTGRRVTQKTSRSPNPTSQHMATHLRTMLARRDSNITKAAFATRLKVARAYLDSGSVLVRRAAKALSVPESELIRLLVVSPLPSASYGLAVEDLACGIRLSRS